MKQTITFQNFILLFIALTIFSCSHGYKKEDNKVYYIEWNEAQGKVTRDIGADISTFKVLDNENYAIDKTTAYYQGNPIDSSDPKSFTPLSDFISKDKNHGFYGRVKIPNSDGKTFELIDGNYTRDKKDVYYIDQPLNSTSPKTFEILKIGHGNWSRDGITYYYSGNKLPVADYKSFTILDEDCFFAKDKYKAYNRDKVLEGVDAATFKYIQRCVGQDKYGCHNGYERCDCP